MLSQLGRVDSNRGTLEWISIKARNTLFFP